MYFVYIIQSTKDSTYYIGYTKNVFERLHTHNNGKVSYTKGHLPYKIVYTEELRTMQKAKEREMQIKSLKNTAYFLKKQLGSPDSLRK